MPGYVSVGELRFIWDRGLLRNLACACGSPFRTCPFWSRAVAGLISKPQEIIEEYLEAREKFRTFDCLKHTAPWGHGRGDGWWEDYASALDSIYKGIREASGARVIVDSSKFPSHGFIAAQLADIDLYVLHLVRDPRAVAFSWQRKKLYDPGLGNLQYMRRYGIFGSTTHWILRNVTTERLWNNRRAKGHYMRLRYEDFARSPRDATYSIMNFAGESCSLDFFKDSRTVVLEPTHELSGNPSRFASGAVELRQDREWTASMPVRERLAISALASLLMLRYGYFRDGRP